MDKKQKQENIVERPPIIAVMGHIDHGKSALLDYIRKSNIVAGEAGGITQHISAYEVEHNNKKITFLDTPGHAAFTAMRSRGAEIADIAILIVSAEEGPKTQTIEAYESIKKAGVPFIVAINKIDRPEANIEKTKQQLMEKEIYLEGYGGDVPFSPISAKSGQGIPELLDTLLLMAELEELKGDKNKQAEGFILETKLDPKKGVCATLIITDGSLKIGDYVVNEDKFTSIRTLENFLGEQIKEAYFSSPVQITGFKENPSVGSVFNIYKSKKEAENVAKEYSGIKTDINQNENKENKNNFTISLIIKADVLGSIEAIKHEINKIVSEKTNLKIISTGVGNITENDIKTAGGDTNTIIVGFSVKADNGAKNLAEKMGIKINTFDIIYKLTEWLEEEIILKTPKVKTEKIIGKIKVLRVFSQTKDKQVLGGRVLEGSISVKSKIKIIRRDYEIGEGKILGLQSQKLEVNEVKEGAEFGMMIESKKEIAPGDVLNVVIIVEE